MSKTATKYQQDRRILCFDYGTKKTGVATGSQSLGTSQPLGLLKMDQGKPNRPMLDGLVSEWQPDIFVVGMPLNMDGSDSDIYKKAQKFANRLHGWYGKPYFFCDERLSSREAREIQGNPEHLWYNQPVDAISAALVLLTWFGSV